MGRRREKLAVALPCSAIARINDPKAFCCKELRQWLLSRDGGHAVAKDNQALFFSRACGWQEFGNDFLLESRPEHVSESPRDAERGAPGIMTCPAILSNSFSLERPSKMALFICGFPSCLSLNRIWSLLLPRAKTIKSERLRHKERYCASEDVHGVGCTQHQHSGNFR